MTAPTTRRAPQTTEDLDFVLEYLSDPTVDNGERDLVRTALDAVTNAAILAEDCDDPATDDLLDDLERHADGLAAMCDDATGGRVTMYRLMCAGEERAGLRIAQRS